MESAKYMQKIWKQGYGIKHYFQIKFTNKHNIVVHILLFRKNMNTKNTQQIMKTVCQRGMVCQRSLFGSNVWLPPTFGH